MLNLYSDPAEQQELFHSCTFSRVKSLHSPENWMCGQWSGHAGIPVEKEDPERASPCQRLDPTASVGLTLLEQSWGTKPRVVVGPLVSVFHQLSEVPECVLTHTCDPAGKAAQVAEE